ncbi:alpha/beta hydrolase [Dermatophilaceae bacterium Sec6.4]
MSDSETYAQVGDIKVRYERHDGPVDGPTFLLVHGLGGSLDNWASVVPLLTHRGSVVSLDLGGFGKTQVAPHRAAVSENLKLLHAFARQVIDGPVVLAGNSMGGLLSAQLAARDPQLVSGAVLIDPAIPAVFRGYPHREVIRGFAMTTLPGLSRIAARRLAASTVRQEVERTIAMVTSRFDNVDPAVIDRHVELSEYRLRNIRGAGPSFEAAARSLLAMLTQRKRYYSVVGRIQVPVLLLHGDRDKLVNVRCARALAKRNSSWTYIEGAGIGHTPMLDFPAWTAEQMLTWTDAKLGELRHTSKAPKTHP